MSKKMPMLWSPHTQDLNLIGLAKYQQRNALLNDALSRECANGVKQ